ncbi:hypothetical protein ACNKHR_02595 [Shigella flexneri]
MGAGARGPVPEHACVTRISFPAVSASASHCWRVGIESKVIMADEAVSALDVSIRGQIINLLLEFPA